MRLREDNVCIRFSTYEDVLDGGGHLEIVQALERLAEERFSAFRDLTQTRAPWRPLDGDLAPLRAHIGAGFHQTARFRLEAEHGALGPLELNAGLHPYSGVYVTQVDARLGGALARERVADLRALAVSWIEAFTPITLQVNDADDDAVQNIDMPRLAELGYGVSVPPEPEGRPGREAVRGQYRFVPSWLGYLGSDALDLLGTRDALATLPDIECQDVAGGILLELAPCPWPCGDETYRDRQARVRDAMGVDALIARDRRSFSYWKRKQ